MMSRHLKNVTLIAACLLLACGVKYQYVHHTSLRQLRLGMTTEEVAKVLEGRYVRRGAFLTNQGYADEFWQIRIGEDYLGRKPKGETGSYPAAKEEDIERSCYYWLGFRDGKLVWWGRIGDWGTATQEEKLQLRVLLDDQENR